MAENYNLARHPNADGRYGMGRERSAERQARYDREGRQRARGRLDLTPAERRAGNAREDRERAAGNAREDRERAARYDREDRRMAQRLGYQRGREVPAGRHEPAYEQPHVHEPENEAEHEAEQTNQGNHERRLGALEQDTADLQLSIERLTDVVLQLTRAIGQGQGEAAKAVEGDGGLEDGIHGVE
jgi:hypothetical protein